MIDSPGDEGLATDQGAKGRMVRPWRARKLSDHIND